MTKREPAINFIVEELLKYPEGISFDDLVKNLKGRLSRVTIKKYLDQIEDVVKTGGGRNTRYQLAHHAKWISEYREAALQDLFQYVRALEGFKRLLMKLAAERRGGNVGILTSKDEKNGNFVRLDLLGFGLSKRIMRYRIILLVDKADYGVNDPVLKISERYLTLMEEVLIQIFSFMGRTLGRETLAGARQIFESESITLEPQTILDGDEIDRRIQNLPVGNEPDKLAKELRQKSVAEIKAGLGKSKMEASSHMDQDFETVRATILARVRNALDAQTQKMLFS